MKPGERLGAPRGHTSQAYPRLPHLHCLWSGAPTFSLRPGHTGPPTLHCMAWNQRPGVVSALLGGPDQLFHSLGLYYIICKVGLPFCFLRINALVAEKTLGGVQHNTERLRGAKRVLTSWLHPSPQHPSWQHGHSRVVSEENTLILSHLSPCWGQPGTALQRISLGSDGPQ